jgi:hypothetical protein
MEDNKHLTASYHIAMMGTTYAGTAATIQNKLRGGVAPWSAAE